MSFLGGKTSTLSYVNVLMASVFLYVKLDLGHTKGMQYISTKTGDSIYVPSTVQCMPACKTDVKPYMMMMMSTGRKAVSGGEDKTGVTELLMVPWHVVFSCGACCQAK